MTFILGLYGVIAKRVIAKRVNDKLVNDKGVNATIPPAREALDDLGPDGGHEGRPISARGRGIRVRWE